MPSADAPATSSRLALARQIFDEPDPPAPAAPEPPMDHCYYDEDQTLVAVKRRIRNADGSKRFVWYTAAGFREGRPGLDGLPLAGLPPYRLPELLASEVKQYVWVVEGEKTCDALHAHGLLGVTVAGGAGQRDFTTLQDALFGRLVVLWPDNDEPGRELMLRVAAALRDYANSIIWVEPPDLPPKGDAVDFFAAGRTVDELWALYSQGNAPPRAAAPEAQADPYAALVANLAPQALAQPVLVELADVTPQAVRWLWPGRIPLGALTILDGDPGLGKSLLTLDLAARVTRGAAMPDGATGDLAGPAGVVLLSAEDSLRDTIKPRLLAAGADTGRIVALTEMQEADGVRLPTLADLPALEQAIREKAARLVVVDPLMAYLGPDVNGHNDQDVRRLLAPLARLAEQADVALLVVRHLNKRDSGNALYRGGGSMGLSGAARSVLLVGKDPDDPEGARRIVAGVKANLAAPLPALAYHVEAVPPAAARVVWEGATAHTPAMLLGSPASPEDVSALDEAKRFLRGYLAAGPQLASAVQAEAEEAGVARITLNRAKSQLGIRSEKGRSGFDGKWVWVLPAPA